MRETHDDGARWREHALSLVSEAHEEYDSTDGDPAARAAASSGIAVISIAYSLAGIMCDLHELVEMQRAAP